MPGKETIMGKMNMTRVILGGIAAGIIIDACEGVINGVVLQRQWADTFAALGKSPLLSVKQIVALNIWGIAVGVLTIWLYAAIRPRYGAGPRTAICAGLAMWAPAFALASAIPVFFHIYPVNLSVASVALEAIEMILAGLAGAAIYKEDEAGVPRSVAARA
jgi:hypothetical protein